MENRQENIMGTRPINKLLPSMAFPIMLSMLVQALYNVMDSIFVSMVSENALTSVSLIFLSAAVTLPGWYQKLAAHAGAGTLVPITGFANSVVSPTIEFKPEGWITGVGAKIFSIAGPVIAYGTLASCVWGVLYWLIGKVG